MNKLILDTSTAYLYVAVIKEDVEVYNHVLFGKNNHSEHLINIIKEGLGCMQANELDEIIIGVGPGSYTGVRVALTVAKTLAWTLNIPLKTISSLTLISSGYEEDGVYGVSSVAKKGHVYGKIFEKKGEEINVLLNDIFLTDDEFAAKCKAYNLTRVAEGEYKFDSKMIDKLSVKVDNVHEVVPNYLRKANS